MPNDTIACYRWNVEEELKEEEIKSEIENTRLKTCRLDINFTNESKRDTCPTSAINDCNMMPMAGSVAVG